MTDIVEKILATPPENLTQSDLITIEFNSFVAHNYWIRWNWSDRKNLGVVKLENDRISA